MNIQTELTAKQKAAIKRSDRSLADNGLTTYTAMEEALYGALTAAHDAVTMGKRLAAMLRVQEVGDER